MKKNVFFKLKPAFATTLSFLLSFLVVVVVVVIVVVVVVILFPRGWVSFRGRDERNSPPSKTLKKTRSPFGFGGNAASLSSATARLPALLVRTTN